MAPEIQGYLPTEKYESRGTYTIAVDMWSLGMVCHELHTGSVPFWKTVDEMDDDNDDDDISGLFRSSLSLKDQEPRYETVYTSVKTHLDQSKIGYETAHTSVKIYLDQTEFRRYCNGSAFPDKLLNKSGVSEDAKEFILSLLEVDPMERPFAQQALRHRWITGGGSAANRSPQQSRSSSQCNTPQPTRLSVTSPQVNYNKQQQPPNPGVNGSWNPQRISSPHNCNTSASPSGSAQRRRHADNYPPRSSYNPNGYASSSLNPNGYQLPGPNTHGHVPPQSGPNPNGYLYQSPDPNSGGYPLSSPDLNVYQSPGYSPNGYQDSVHNTNSLQPSNGMMSYGGQPHQNMGPAPGEGNPYFSQSPIYTQQGMPSQQPAGYEGPPRGYEGPMHPGAMIGSPCSCPECYESDSSSDDNGMHLMPMPGGMGPPAMVPTMVGQSPSGVITYYWT
ncbi:uncharacterized protein LAJ45_11507 [Morchella importuna]|uniref:uncharacterized protein n=1 Tax=Morchella importuna TaxID=1174673 RepID=UPI001E8EBD1B|nr:uncharacterized protein LAJ45_11507 [Morchella importuna]KAH8144496.1 hypothetical protein LAJ45_11507 [Morchella importuna]